VTSKEGGETVISAVLHPREICGGIPWEWRSRAESEKRKREREIELEL